MTLGVQDFVTGDDTVIVWRAPVNEDLGDGGEVFLNFEFYDGIEDLTGTLDLTVAPDNNYATCAACFRLITLNAAGDMIVRQFFPTAGSVTLSESPFANPEPALRSMIGSLDGVTLSEVTIDPDTFESTVVVGGECLTIGSSLALNADDVPNAFTCEPTTWEDGATCNCACGVTEPDCATGQPDDCAVTQNCFDATCVDIPANDTCATGVVLTAAAPVDGTSIGATGDYSAGLEGATCTGFSQSGPDVVYTLALTAGQNITIDMTTTSTTYDGSLSLVGPGAAAVCNADPITTCVVGADAGLDGAAEQILNFAVPTTGTYYLIVDSFYGAGPQSAGAFTLTLTIN